MSSSKRIVVFFFRASFREWFVRKFQESSSCTSAADFGLEERNAEVNRKVQGGSRQSDR